MLSIRASDSFLQKLLVMRPTLCFAENGLPPTPLMPWITPAVPPRLFKAMLETGIVRHLHPGEYIFKQNERFDRLVMLLNGLGGRAFGSLYTQTAAAIALSVPMRILGGNHCFFSARPGVGRYFALTEADVLSARSADLKHLMRADFPLAEESASFLDMLLQSDRIGLGAIALLPTRSRILVWALSWGFIYGDLERDALGREVLRLSPVLPMDLLARVICANPSQIKRDFAALKAEKIFGRDGQDFLFLAEALDSVWNWLYSIEELESALRRSPEWRGYVAGKRIDRAPAVRRLIADKSGR